MMRTCLLTGIVVAGLLAGQDLVTFEPEPRVVASGRDPMLALRPSGALALMRVEKGNIWFQCSHDGGDSFEDAVPANDVEGEVASHAESSPQLQLRSRSELYLLWQTRLPGPGGASALRFARSTDWGETFSKAIHIDPSGLPASQSFFTLNVSPKGIVHAAWLDGRDRTGAPGAASLYVARSTDRGISFEKSVKVTGGVCPCCRPSIVYTGESTVHIAWRGVFGDNLRDIAISTSTDGGRSWGAGVRVAEDNWKLNGCPHSGAATAALGKRLFLVWHTVRENKAAVYLAYSDDGGRTFSPRQVLSGDTLDPNHPYLAEADGRIAAVFQARDSRSRQGWGKLGVYYREIDGQGRLSPLVRIGPAEASASYPTVKSDDAGRIYVAWTEPSKQGPVVVLARGRAAQVASLEAR